MIKVYSSKFSAEPTESHAVTHGTVGAWLAENVPSYDRAISQQFSVTIDGELIHQCQWHDKLVDKNSDVRIVVEPKGTELFLGALFVAATRMMTPKIPKMNNLAQVQGKDLDSATAKGNKVKVNQTRMESAGRCKIYGNYTKPAHRYFADRRDQRIEMCLDVGTGEVEVIGSEIYIGGTPASSFGSDVSFAVYPPGVDFGHDPRHQWWHDAIEVGSGSNGSSGLDLTRATGIPTGYEAPSHILSGRDVSIPGGSVSFPVEWTAGMIVRMVSPYPYEVVKGGDADIIQGRAVDMLAPVVGQQVEIDGPGAGLYTIRDVIPYVAPVPANTGSPSHVTGSTPPSTYDFSATPESFSVTIGGVTYPVTISNNTVDLDSLVWTINNLRPLGAQYGAVAVSGKVRIFDVAQANTGRPISVSGGNRIFGLSKIYAPGIADSGGSPEQLPGVTLNGLDSLPVNGLPGGPQALTIGPSGLRYRIVSASPGSLNLERLTSAGGSDLSFPGFDYLHTAGVVITLDPSNLQGGYRGPFAACPEGEVATHIQWDIFHPQGLCGIGREGQIYQIASFHAMEWRDMAMSGAWTRIDIDQSGDSRDAQGFSYTIELPYPMRPEVRVVKREQRLPGRAESEAQNQMAWYGLRTAVVGSKTSYPNSTILCLTARGGDRMSADAEAQVWVRGTRKLPVRRNGVWLPPEPTRDIVPFCLNVLRSAGYTDADLDLAEWDALDALLQARGDTYDRVFTDAVTVQQAVEEALACGFASLTTKNGLLTPVRDQPQQIFKQLYTFDTQSEGGELDIRFNLTAGDDYDGVDVQYIDPVKWQTATVRCRIPGDPPAKKAKLVVADGITGRLQAWRFGMRELMDIRYRRKSCEWGTGMSALNSNFLDLVKVGGDTPGYAQSLIMRGISADKRTVTLRSPIDLTALEPPYFVSVRRIDGSCFGPVMATAINDRTFTMAAPLDFDPILDQPGAVEPPYVLFGQGYSVLIDEIIPDGTESARIEATFYDERLYQYDDAPLPSNA